MRIFEFSTDVIPIITKEIGRARSYVRVAIFQLHNKDIFEALSKKLEEGVKVEIFTLPYDGINKDIQADVIPRFKSIEKKGAKLYFCKWNVGDPERTTTAVNRWYSYHGKFMVTDQCAISLSANLTQERELDAAIIFDDEMEKIKEFNSKFDLLLDLFIREDGGYDGSIRRRILDTGVPGVSSVFELPRSIETDMHESHWVKQYPSVLCPPDTSIDDKLYITPFDCRGLHLIQSLISNASRFVYISTESFTDDRFSRFLIRMRLKDLDLRILSGATSMDFTDRMQSMFRELLSQNIKIRTVEGELHAKLILTDKNLVVSSVNLNKMNLGFNVTQKYWRENTETISVCSDPRVIETARVRYISIYDHGIDVETRLAERLETTVGNMFKSMFNLRSKSEVKSLFARLLVRKEIEAKRVIVDIGRITARLMKFYRRDIVEKNDFISAVILYYLSERKQDINDLREKLSILSTKLDIEDLLGHLIQDGFIERAEDYYKIKLDSLF